MLTKRAFTKSKPNVSNCGDLYSMFRKKRKYKFNKGPFNTVKKFPIPFCTQRGGGGGVKLKRIFSSVVKETYRLTYSPYRTQRIWYSPCATNDLRKFYGNNKKNQCMLSMCFRLNIQTVNVDQTRKRRDFGYWFTEIGILYNSLLRWRQGSWPVLCEIWLRMRFVFANSDPNIQTIFSELLSDLGLKITTTKQE